MNIKIISLAVLTASLSACVGHRKAAQVEPAAPAPTEALASLHVEPLGCTVYAGDDRPDYDAQALECIVQWLGEAHEYLAEGGKPTKYTSPESIERNRATARKLSARIAHWLKKGDFHAEAPPAPSVGPAPEMESQQHYLSGILFYQKGDVEGARREWLLAKKLDPANNDAQEGLDRLGQER
ncbi:MAG: hypothetical protein Q8T11_08735 [Elusimicrobiota bacterium]|nr:hypothetical protein [Elusimicrobiota bacterium]